MIQVQNLFFQYPKVDTPTLKGLNFEIDKGEIFGFLGPSGSGKSTTQKILYKILSQYDGEIKIDGVDLSDMNRSYFESIGVGFELPNHYLKLTGKENLDLFASFYKPNMDRNVEALFEMVDLQSAMNNRVETYSKGMKMRLNFIRAIQHNPDILFFDEPTAGLDPISAQNIKQYILKLKSDGKTIFITTHDMHTADELCDMVSFIVDGNIMATDTPKNFRDKYGKDLVKVELKNGTSNEFALKNLGKNEGFIEFIKRDTIDRMHTLEASLEDVFIIVTGKGLKR